jgi:hypothetical protein
MWISARIASLARSPGAWPALFSSMPPRMTWLEAFLSACFQRDANYSFWTSPTTISLATCRIP